MADRDAISPAYNPLPPSDYDTERWVQTTPFSPSMDSPTTLVGSPMSPSTEYKGSIAERMKFVSTSSISKEDDTGSQMEGESEREREEREEMRMGWKQRLKARMKRYRALGLMVGFYTVALLLALGHFSFNSALHNKRPGIDTVNQQQASFVGIILTNLAKAVLTTGLGVGYVQVVWYKLRRRWTSARLIDRILSLPWSPEGMFHFGTVLKKAPLEWVFALFCLTVPIVLSLPPTSMKVVMAPLMSYTAPRVVPAVDLGFRNNETWEGLEGGLLFNPLPATYLYYHNKPLVNPSWGAKPVGFVILAIKDTIGLVSNTLRSGRIEPPPNPFSTADLTNPLAKYIPSDKNATYSFTFAGPKLQCTPVEPVPYTPVPIGSDGGFWNALAANDRPVYKMFGNEMYFRIVFAPKYRKPANVTFDMIANHIFRDEKNVTAPVPVAPFAGLLDERSQITCELGLTNYTVTMVYVDDVGQVTAKDDGTFEPIRPSFGLYHYFMEPRPFYDDLAKYEALYNEDADEMESTLTAVFETAKYYKELSKAEVREGRRVSDDALEMAGNSTSSWGVAANATQGRKMGFKRRYLEMQARGISQALYETLSGDIVNFGYGPFETVTRTIIHQSPRLARTYAGEPGWINFNLTPQLLEETMANITASLPHLLLAQNEWRRAVPVTVTPWALVYDFNKRFLVLPYGASLLIAAGFLMAGIFALQRNGVSAAKGFLQIVSTTTASEELRKAAKECCLGGEENFSERLQGIELKFGDSLIVSEGKAGYGSSGEGLGLGLGVRRREGWLTSLGTREEVETSVVNRERRTVGDLKGLLRW